MAKHSFERFPRWIDNKVKGKRFIDNLRYCIKSCPAAIWEVGYFYVSGMMALKLDLDRLDQLRVIIGIGTDESTATTVERSMKRIKRHVIREINADLEGISFNEEGDYFEYIYGCLLSGKIKVHVSREPSHNKVYWFDQLDKPYDVVMHGSANLSRSGLGVVYQRNNLQIDSSTTANPTVLHYKRELEQAWQSSVPFNRELIDVIDRHPDVRKHRKRDDGDGDGGRGSVPKDPEGTVFMNPPSFFKYIINKHKLFHLFDSGQFKLRSFQLVDYLTCKECIQNTGGVILSDEAGLGKTPIACRIIRDYYEQSMRFLIIVPPGSTMKQWIEHLEMFGIGFENGSKIISEGILPYESFAGKDWSGFDLVVIDEAHHFRSDRTARFNNFMSKFKSVNPSADVLLVTATPVNNTVLDLVNQVKMIENAGKFRASVGPAFDRFKILARKNDFDNQSESEFYAIADELQKNLVVRTTTRQLREAGETMVINGKQANFQEIIPLQKVYAFSGRKYGEIFDRLFPDLIDKLSFPHVGLFSSLVDIGGGDEGTGYGFQVTSLYKRFESSIYAFKKSLENLKDREGKMARMLLDPKVDRKIKKARTLDGRIRGYGWKADKKTVKKRDKLVEENKQTRKDLEEIWENADPMEGEEIVATIGTVNPSRNIDGTSVKDVLRNVASDVESINGFLDLLSRLDPTGGNGIEWKDDKFESLLAMLHNFDPGDKVLVFTEFTDTGSYVYQRLRSTGMKNVGFVHGQLPTAKREELIVRFCPVFSPKEMVRTVKQKHDGMMPPELRVLVATDTVSQSVNLQEARYVINYDLPWNPMLMYQRNGRARRINNPNPVDVINFIPDPNIDASLKLVERLEEKISDISSVIGMPSKILSRFDDYGSSNDDVKDRFLKRRERIKSMGTDEPGMVSIKHRPVSMLVKRVIKEFEWSPADVKMQPGREEIPYTIIKDSGLKGTLVFYSIIMENEGEDTFKQDAFFVDGSGEMHPIDGGSIPVPLTAGMRPLSGWESMSVTAMPTEMIARILKESRQSVYQTKEMVRASTKANREKNRMVHEINRSAIYNRSINESMDDREIKSKIKKLVADLSKRSLVTNDTLAEIRTYVKKWLRDGKNFTGDKLKGMLVDIEVIENKTRGAGETVRGKDLHSSIDGCIVFRS